VPYCTNCGTQQQTGQRFCTVCGAVFGGTNNLPVPTFAPMPPVAIEERVGDARVAVGLSMQPSRQRRWSVAFRFLLAIPLLIVLELVLVAATFATIGSWFCALFTKRVPDGLQSFVTSALRLMANVYAYTWLLIPRWPGFAFDEAPKNHVSLRIDHVRLNRGAVFFRCFLAVPALIVNELLNYGVLPLAAVMWLWALITGKEPRALHQAAALALRFQIRAQAYYFLLTPTQPFAGFAGDATTTSPLDEDDADPISALTRWHVSRGARAILVLMLVVPVAAYGIQAALGNPIGTRLEAVIGRAVVSTTNKAVVADVSTFEQSRRNCTSLDERSCVARAATVAFSSISTEQNLIQQNIFLPATARVAKQNYENQLGSMESILYAIEDANSLSEQTTFVEEFESAYSKFESDYRLVLSRLGG
jgi:hypothetical protein